MGGAIINNLIATHVKQTNPTTNYNSYPKLPVRDWTGTDVNSYLYWTPPFPRNATILSAKLVFYALAEPGTGTKGWRFNRLGVKFDATKTVYNNRPTTFLPGSLDVNATLPIADKTKFELDVTAWMQSVANGGTWYGLRVIPTLHEDNVLWMYSELWTDPSLRPRVEMTWSDAPGTPQGLSPSSGRLVSLAKPTVKGQYIDVSGSVALQAIQVQINSADTWTSPAFDSGIVLTSVPELDLATTAYAGLADGQTVYWRLRFQDGAGYWSPWSAAAVFGRDIKGTLAVNNPPAGTPKVEDATPPIAWALTGETQAAYQIQITHKVNGVDQVDWDTKKLTGTITSLTVPAGAINEPTNTTYTVTVRIWDNKQRENTPTDPPYVEVVRDFTFIPGATSGSTSLTAVADAIRPKVVLTWISATFPDRFNVLRNGKVIAAALDPNDTFVSGTTHTWTDNSPSPGRSLTYQIQRVVNDVASATNSTANLTIPQKQAIWLREPISGLEVPIFSEDGPDFTLGEIATILRAIAPDSVPMAINQSLSGIEAPVTGSLIDAYGQTAQYWRDQYLLLRGLRVKRVYLTIGEVTVLVVAQQFTYKQRGNTPEIIFDVGFTVYQQDSVNNLLTSA